MSLFVETLLIKPTWDEAVEIDRLILEIESLKAQTSCFDEFSWQKAFEKMAPFRLRGTANLKRGNVESWIEANQWIANKSLHQPIPVWRDILKLNQIIRKSIDDIKIRDCEVYLGPWAPCPAAELEFGIKQFEKMILASEEYHPLIQAALIHYWIVSLHPFIDGNGRTSILAADWVLTTSGYLPQTFESKLDALVGHLPERKTKSVASRAIIKILKNIAFSYHLSLVDDQPQKLNER